MSSHMTDGNVLLVGAGSMARAYLDVLIELKDVPTVVGRSPLSAQTLAQEKGVSCAAGGIDNWLEAASEVPSRAIVAVNIPSLAPTTLSLLKAGVSSILVEKPAALTLPQLETLVAEAEGREAEVYVAYNRRFYHSSLTARKMISDDGGATSMTFDFTELAERVRASNHPASVKRAWLLANSSHVMDLAFHLAGDMDRVISWRTGGLEWHPSGSTFVGSGMTMAGAPFSYHADWESPGRWGVRIQTKNHRLSLQPLERLTVLSHGSFETTDIPLPSDDPDRRFKPGLYRQVEAFLSNPETSPLPTLASHSQFGRNVIAAIAGASDLTTTIQ